MKIEKYEKIGHDKYRIYLDNGEVIDTYGEVILQNDLLLKRELTDLDYSYVFSETNLVEIYLMCEKYIGIRLRSVKEIRDYLFRKHVSEDDIEEVIFRLKKNNLLNDEIFCECFIKDKIKFTSMGSYKIIALLKEHQISNDIIQKYSYLFDSDEMREKLEKMIDKQIRANVKLDRYKLRNKIYYSLMNQGYSSSDIVSLLNEKF